ncbi:CHC2 zinc finger domain-containing protein [Terrabacter carboxydivorans]|uniref:Zinc finger CHC2-type domain-containing protein n=1 Tax=Terrabacter carboxydivorans TaxID=619730 RepID=A0ABN3MH33_9MICO
MNLERRTVDVDAIRARHPLPDVVAAAGIELHQRGHGYMACCPFHEDKTPSLSVGGVPDRFHCFGCGASGDVIDFVQRTRGLDFLGAVAELDGTPGHDRSLSVIEPRARLRVVPATPDPDIAFARALEINELAWQHFSTPVAAGFASHYLKNQRGIDVEPLSRELFGTVLVGHATHGWSTLTDQLRSGGVEDEELVAMDLAMRTRGGQLVDTYRNRLIFPITNERGEIHGFIGRDLSGHPAAPKYRNPTHTPVFDKSQLLYRPAHPGLATNGEVLVVEGALDALAVAAAAAATGTTHRVAACATNGLSASPAHVQQVLSMSTRPPRIAFDGDTAGEQGVARWLLAASIERGAPLFVTRMPSGVDPADWLASHGPNGLRDLLAGPVQDQDGEVPGTAVPGREVIRLLLDRVDDPIRDAVEIVAGLASQLPAAERAQLLRDSAAEMTRHGWNPHDVYSKALHYAMREQGSPTVPMPPVASTPSLI